MARYVVANLSKQRRPCLRSNLKIDHHTSLITNGTPSRQTERGVHAYLCPETCIAASNSPLKLWTDREFHLPPKASGGRASATLVSFRRRVQREIKSGSPAYVCVAPSRDFFDVFLCVWLQESDGCSAGRVRAFHAENCQRVGGVKHRTAQGGKLDVLLTAPSARYFVDLFRYALRCGKAMNGSWRVELYL